MSLIHLSYAAMLIFCLSATIPLHWYFRLTVFGQPRRLALTVLLAGTPFLVWDLWVTELGHWWFDADQTLPPRILGVPIEEVSFFVVIPIVTVLTFEAVKVARRGGLVRRAVDRDTQAEPALTGREG